ncbi:MAG: LLM class F420-dependent oxidoreductase [Gammaproteobacteria bacterium]|nr:LLM class F420-dependent oxidoreductase [Gammaproteobacteria bacterium]
MHLGLFIFATEYAIRIDELAKAAEDRGFESLWVPEHTHIPTSRRSPWPGGAELPKEYSHTLDPFVSLMAAAAVTKKLKVGTGICLIIERDTITTAKEAATLDLLSDGRFLFGVGAGWNAEEMENHGTEFQSRFKLEQEQIKAIKQIWTEDEAEFHGQFVNFDPIWCWPKPIQRPHPPILLGGSGRYTLKRVVEFCDGWIPLGRSMDAVLEEVAELKIQADRVGRDINTISLSVFGSKPDREVLQRYAEAGFERVILGLPSEGRDTVLPKLDEWAELIANV